MICFKIHLSGMDSTTSLEEAHMVEEDIIESVMEEHEPRDFVPALIDLANQNGGVDNSTIVSFLVN